MPLAIGKQTFQKFSRVRSDFDMIYNICPLLTYSTNSLVSFLKIIQNLLWRYKIIYTDQLSEICMIKLCLTIISLSIIFIIFLLEDQNSSAHPIFTDPFTLNYTSNNTCSRPDFITIDYDSETRNLKVKVDAANDSSNREITSVLSLGREHNLRDLIGENRILDSNLTDSLCFEPELCNLVNLKINTPLRSVDLKWTSDSEISLRHFDVLDEYIESISNLTRER